MWRQMIQRDSCNKVKLVNSNHNKTNVTSTMEHLCCQRRQLSTSEGSVFEDLFVPVAT